MTHDHDLKSTERRSTKNGTKAKESRDSNEKELAEANYDIDSNADRQESNGDISAIAKDLSQTSIQSNHIVQSWSDGRFKISTSPPFKTIHINGNNSEKQKASFESKQDDLPCLDGVHCQTQAPRFTVKTYSPDAIFDKSGSLHKHEPLVFSALFPSPKSPNSHRKLSASPRGTRRKTIGSNEKRPTKSSLKKKHHSGGDKLNVRFADSEGKALASIRTVDSDGDQDSKPLDRLAYLHELYKPPWFLGKKKILRPLFQLPHPESAEFYDKFERLKVCLKSMLIGEDLSVVGKVAVKNMDFHKAVYVRLTWDRWRTMRDIPAKYVPHACNKANDCSETANKETDQFAFKIPCPPALEPNDQLELAVRFHCVGEQFWDNNDGSNYKFECVQE